MVEISAALAAHLGGEVTTVCQCWRLTRGDGAVLGFTDHDRELPVDGTVFQPETGLTASEAKSTLGLAVDTVDVEGALSAADIDEDDIIAGLYDGAKVETLLVNWRDPTSFARLRTAIIGKIVRRDGAFVAELESETWALDQPNGRIIRRRCDAELGDGRCKVNLQSAGFRGSGTVMEVQTGDVLRVSGLDGFDSGWFSNGILTWTSGALAGRQERVTDHTGGAGGTMLSLWREGPAAVTIGDTFDIVAGCDKQFATCKAKFSNGVNFRGFPHLPGDDAAYGYATEDGVFDGEALVK